MASASAQAAEPDNATDTGQEALAIAVETSSRRTVHELTRVCTLLEPWRARPAVRDCATPSCSVAGDPVRHDADDLGLPSLALRIGIARIVVDGEAVLGAVDFDELVLSPKLLGRPAGRFHRDEGVLGAMHDERRHLDVAKHGVRPQIEHLVEQWPAELERRRVGEEALPGQFGARSPPLSLL